MADAGEFRFLAEEAQYYYHLFQRDDEWNRDKLRNFFTFLYPNHEEVKNALEELDNYLREFKDRDYNHPVFRRTVLDSMAVQTNRTLRQLDDLSQIAVMKPYVDLGKRGMNFADYSPRFYMKPWEGSGNFGYVTGPRGKPLGVGKTDTALLMAEMALSEGKRVQTNIILEDPPPGVTEVRTLSALMQGSIRNLREGYLTRTVLDEAPQFLERERATSRESVNMKKAEYLFRKIGTDLDVIAQRDKEVTTSIAEMAGCHVQKLDKTEMIYRRGHQTFMIRNVPGTSLKFKTKDMAGFVIDMDISDMHDSIVRSEDGKDQFSAILEYIEKDRRKISWGDIKTSAKVLYLHGGWTQAEIGKFFGIAQGTISKWFGKMGIRGDDSDRPRTR